MCQETPSGASAWSENHGRRPGWDLADRERWGETTKCKLRAVRTQRAHPVGGRFLNMSEGVCECVTNLRRLHSACKNGIQRLVTVCKCIRKPLRKRSRNCPSNEARTWSHPTNRVTGNRTTREPCCVTDAHLMWKSPPQCLSDGIFTKTLHLVFACQRNGSKCETRAERTIGYWIHNLIRLPWVNLLFPSFSSQFWNLWMCRYVLNATSCSSSFFGG